MTAGEDNYAANYLNGQEYDGGANNLELEQLDSTKISDSNDYDALDNSKKQKVEKVKKDKKLVESVETYFSERSTVFNKANKKDKDSTLKTKVRGKMNINKKVKDNSINRIEKIREVEEKSKLEFTKGEVESEIRDVTYEPNGEVVLDVYEWTWVEYNDGKDKFGYGTDHEVTLEETDGSYNVISDEYDETDIWDHQTEDYEESSLYSEEKELHSDIESNISQLSSDVAPLSQANTINNLATQPVSYSATSLADTLSKYDVTKAINYADKWVNKGAASYDKLMKTDSYNLSEFGYYKKDCCNFVSQCLNYGGIPFTHFGKDRINTSTSQWWFDTSETKKIDNYEISPLPWRQVKSFVKYWTEDRGVKSVNAKASNCYPGNPVYYINSNGDAHIWICTGYDSNGNPVFNAHNRDVYHFPFSQMSASGVTLKTLLFKNSNVTINKPSNARNLGDASGTNLVSMGSNLTAGAYQYFKFTATATRTYYIYTKGDVDTNGTLYQEKEYEYYSKKNTKKTYTALEEIVTNEDGGLHYNFEIRKSLVKGRTYYIKVRGYTSNTSGSYTLYIGKTTSN